MMQQNGFCVKRWVLHRQSLEILILDTSKYHAYTHGNSKQQQ